MDFKNKRIIEALQMQPLSEEEKASRHILGRLWGPIATCVDSTRNGRFYNKPLWEKALNDDIFLEKVATKALFLELGHPADREETDMRQACACIPEVPKIVDNDLYAYVDILDTPNGRLLKTLVDYGFVPGISSRGSGDVLANDQVDPETFFLETWDIVQLPAVKKARLNICESFDPHKQEFKKVLAESYKAAKEEDKETMKQALENLNIDLEDENTPVEESKRILTAADIPWDPSEEPLTEETNTELTTCPECGGDRFNDTTGLCLDCGYDEKAWGSLNEEDSELVIEDDTDDIDTEEQTIEVPNDSVEELADENVEDEVEEISSETIKDFKDALDEYPDDTEVAFEPIQIDGEDLEIKSFESELIDDTLVVGVNCEAAEESAAEADTNIEENELDDDTEETIEIEASTNSEDSAEDNGDDEVVESFKEIVRQKDALEEENNKLRKEKAVGDTKVEDLQEEVKKYKTAFVRVSKLAEKAGEFETQVKTLREQLTQSKNTVKRLTNKVNDNTQQLKESADTNTLKVKRLNEELETLSKKSEDLEAKLKGQTTQYTKKLQERTELAKKYKSYFIETLTRYVDSKASMLGVNPSEITSRLNENYTLADVDAVCDQILDSTVNFSRLPFGSMNRASARITESAKTKKQVAPEFGYEIDDSLLELAGLKK